jgi:hypothetical protein
MLPLISFMFTCGAATVVKQRVCDAAGEIYRKPSFVECFRWIEMTNMPRVGEFCLSNISRMLLGVIIILTLASAIGFWLYQAPGQGTSIEQPAHVPLPAR